MDQNEKKEKIEKASSLSPLYRPKDSQTHWTYKYAKGMTQQCRTKRGEVSKHDGICTEGVGALYHNVSAFHATVLRPFRLASYKLASTLFKNVSIVLGDGSGGSVAPPRETVKTVFVGDATWSI